jgi:hypothetical protein
MNQKSYNPNSKNGRRNNRDRAEYNYQSGTPDYRKSINKTMGYIYTVIIVFIILLFIIVAKSCGVEAAVKMLK